MAKGLRSKYKRRIRSVRRDHYYEIEGQHKLQEISNKLHDPTYDFKDDGALPPNAFLEPANPSAMFPQHAKPHLLDFRSHKMAASGFASKGNFRKIMSDRAVKSKYADVIKTREELDIEEADLKAFEENQMSDHEDEVTADQIRKTVTVDDITETMSKKMKLSKKKAKKAAGEVDVKMEVTKTISKPGEQIRKLKEKSKRKRSRAQLMF
jgi:hypothetical protein